MTDFAALLTAVAGRQIAPDLAADFARTLPRYGITTPLRIAHFVAQVAEETGGFRAYVENMNYSAAGLLRTWPSRFTQATAAAYAHRPEAIANLVYANRMGNGPPESGDGWRYRGRGDLETTGRAAYAEAARESGQDLVNCPELLEGFGGPSLEAACAFWSMHGCNELADADNLGAVTKRVNGGLINFARRRQNLLAAKAALAAQASAPEAVAPPTAPVDQPAAEPAPAPSAEPVPARLIDAEGQSLEIPTYARSLWTAYGHRAIAWGGGMATVAAGFLHDHLPELILFGGLAALILLVVIAWTRIREAHRDAITRRALAAPPPGTAPDPRIAQITAAVVAALAQSAPTSAP